MWSDKFVVLQLVEFVSGGGIWNWCVCSCNANVVFDVWKVGRAWRHACQAQDEYSTCCWRAAFFIWFHARIAVSFFVGISCSSESLRCQCCEQWHQKFLWIFLWIVYRCDLGFKEGRLCSCFFRWCHLANTSRSPVLSFFLTYWYISVLCTLWQKPALLDGREDTMRLFAFLLWRILVPGPTRRMLAKLKEDNLRRWTRWTSFTMLRRSVVPELQMAAGLVASR